MGEGGMFLVNSGYAERKMTAGSSLSEAWASKCRSWSIVLAPTGCVCLCVCVSRSKVEDKGFNSSSPEVHVHHNAFEHGNTEPVVLSTGTGRNCETGSDGSVGTYCYSRYFFHEVTGCWLSCLRYVISCIW